MLNYRDKGNFYVKFLNYHQYHASGKKTENNA